jgi:hypothetical protein
MRSFLTSRGYTKTAGARRRASALVTTLGLLFFFTSSAAVIQLATGARFFSADEVKSPPCGSSVPLPQPTSTASGKP